MKNKDKLLLSISATTIAPLSVLAIVSCQTTIDQRVQTVADEIGNNKYEVSSKNWIATNKDIDADTVSENVNKAKNKTDEAHKYMKLPSKSESFIDSAGTAKIEIVTCEADDKYNIENTNDSRLKISFKVKKGDKLSEIKYVYAIGFKSVQEKYKKDVQDVAKELEKIKLNTENNIYVRDLNYKNLTEHIIGLPNSYTPEKIPVSGIYNGKTQIFLKEVIIINDPEQNNESASVELVFEVRKGKEIATVSKKINGFISSWQKNKKEVDEKFNVIEKWELTPNSKGKSTIPSRITKENFEQCISNTTNGEEFDKSEIKGLSIDIQAFFPNDKIGELEVRFALKKGQAVSNSVTKKIIGFRISDVQDVYDVENAINSIGALEVKDIKNPPYIHEVTIENIRDFVTGLPESNHITVASTQLPSNAVLFNIDSVRIKLVNGSDYESNTIIVSMTFSKGGVTKTIEKEISGFASKKDFDQNQVNGLIASVSSNPGDEGNEGIKYLIKNSSTNENQIRPIDINLNNYKNYVSGIPTSSNNFGVTVTVIKITPASNTITNDQIDITLEYKLNQIKETRSYRVGGYLSDVGYWQQKVKKESEKPLNLSITAEGENITIKNLNNDLANINKYVSGIPTLENGIKITALSAKEKNGSTAIIEFEFSKNVGFDGNREVIVKAIKNVEVTGFRTPSKQDQIDVDAAANEQFQLSITDIGRNTLASAVNIENYSQYITGFPETKNDVILVVTNVYPSPVNDIIVFVELKFQKNSASSRILKKEVTGFRSIAKQDKIDVDTEYNKLVIDNIQLSINEEGKKKTPQSITKENVKNYVNGFPIPGNNVNVVIEEVTVANENSVNVTFVLSKGAYKSTPIKKVVSGFRTQAEQDKIDVDASAAQVVSLSISELGTTVHATAVTPENISKYVLGIPTGINGVTVQVIKTTPRTNQVDNNILDVTIRYSKNEYMIDKSFEVIGFRVPTKQELFDYYSKNITFEITDLGRKMTAWEVATDVVSNKKNITDFVSFIFPPNSIYQLNSSVFSIEPSNDETSLVLTMTFSDNMNGFTSNVTKTVNGFVSRSARAKMEVDELNEILQGPLNIKQDIVRKIYSRDVARNTEKLYEIMTLPRDKRLAKIKIICEYGTKELGTTKLSVFVKIIDIVNNESTKQRLIQINGFLDPFRSVRELIKTAVEGNTIHRWIFTGQKNSVNPSFNDAKVGSWQTSWITWGENQILKDYRNNTGEWAENIRDSIHWFFEWWKRENNAEDVNFVIKGTASTNNALFERSGYYPSPYILCEQRINMNASVEGYGDLYLIAAPSIYVRFVLKNGYWK